MRIVPLSTAIAEHVRRARADLQGNPAVVEIATYGVPCRHCLQDAQVGETMLLFSHCPFETDGPYREVGPIYIHERPCRRYDAVDTIPVQLRQRLLALRGYDAAGNMIAADVVEGRTMDDLLGTLLGRPDVARVHVRNARPGCFACAIVR